MNDAAAEKAALRRVLRARWQSASTSAPGEVTSALLPWVRERLSGLADPVVAGYIRHGHEVDVEPMLQTLIAEGVVVVLPRIIGQNLEFVLWDGRSLTEGRYGLMEPRGDETRTIGSIQVLVVPAMACDGSMVRLGRGGGFYDRALQDLAAESAVVAVVGDDALLPAGRIPREAHDIQVHAIATATRVIPASAG
jgi:5-formyltetrahydrofolate cyclo-ligase